MSDIAHKISKSSYRACVCGSEWNHLANECSSIIPLRVFTSIQTKQDVEDYDNSYFECRKGHAFCGRH